MSVSTSGSLNANEWTKHRLLLDSTQGTIVFSNSTIAVYQFKPVRGFKDIVLFDWCGQSNLMGNVVSISDADSHVDSGGEPFTFYINGLANYEVPALPAILNQPKTYDTITLTLRIPPAYLALGNTMPTNWNLELILYEHIQSHPSFPGASTAMRPPATNPNSYANINSLSQTFRPSIPTFSPAISRSRA